MSLEQQPDAVQASTAEQQTSTNEPTEVEQIPRTARGQIAELFRAATSDDDRSRQFLLRVVQPGLAGLMDGSVSTLAPIFATAFATKMPFTAFLVGMASATGAGISMAFSEALSDDGQLTGRGSPVVRGAITGIMTFFGGALHTLPFLIVNLRVALFTAYFVVAFELIIISAIRHRYFGTSWWLSLVPLWECMTGFLSLKQNRLATTPHTGRPFTCYVWVV